MSLRAKIIVYLVVIHLIWAAMAVFVFYDNRIWLLLVELFFMVSIVFGVLLIRAFFVPLDLIRTGAELMNERDFSCKFIETGQPETDQLIRVYNRMIEALREERLRITEKEHFLDSLVNASPSGIIILDYDARISQLNPAALRLLDHPVDLFGRTLREFGRNQRPGNCRPPGRGQSTIVTMPGNRRIKCQKSQFFDRGFARQFVLLEELTEELRLSEKRAYEKLIRMMSHEVSNSVGAISSLLESCQAYAEQLSDSDREDFTNALTVARERAQHLNSFTRRFAEVVQAACARAPGLQPRSPPRGHCVALQRRAPPAQRLREVGGCC